MAVELFKHCNRCNETSIYDGEGQPRICGCKSFDEMQEEMLKQSFEQFTPEPEDYDMPDDYCNVW